MKVVDYVEVYDIEEKHKESDQTFNTKLQRLDFI